MSTAQRRNGMIIDALRDLIEQIDAHEVDATAVQRAHLAGSLAVLEAFEEEEK